jgi:hypothetical protein
MACESLVQSGFTKRVARARARVVLIMLGGDLTDTTNMLYYCNNTPDRCPKYQDFVLLPYA